VALGAVARQLLERFGISIVSHVVRIGEAALPDGYGRPAPETIAEISENSEVRCIDGETETAMIEAIRAAKKAKESLGGIVEVIVSGLPVGLGGFAQWSDRLDGRLAGALMAVHSAKGVEIGLGFELSTRRGSKAHDEIFHDPQGDRARKGFYRRTNRAGGLEGGITNGEPIVVRIAGKPLSTLTRPLKTVDVKS
jgi:chorismate synthase